MWPFRRSPTPSDGPDRHAMTLDLIEQVAALRGQVRAMEVEWDAVRVQIQKGWQRVEKANERAERRKSYVGEGPDEPEAATPGPEEDPAVPLHGFAAKLDAMKRGA